MLYKPSWGKFKDNCVIWHEGVFYLFSMFTKDRTDLNYGYNNVWLAKSTDGVHWQDVGAVVEDAPFRIWAQYVHKVEDTFYLNHGSFGEGDYQNVLKFWKSKDLEHWEYMGEESDVGPYKAGFAVEDRLDHMCVIKHKGTYYGYAAGPNGFLKSSDGIHWEFCNKAKIIFGNVPPSTAPRDQGPFETCGCHEINGKFYYLGGWFNYMGRRGYGVYALHSEYPMGTYYPDENAYRLSGNSTRWVSIWARFVPTDKELLITSYMQDGYGYECGDTWMPPLKKAVVDKEEHLRLVYWDGNDALCGIELNSSENRFLCYQLKNNETIKKLELLETLILELKTKEYPSTEYIPVDMELAILDRDIEAEDGTYITGTFESLSDNEFSVIPSVGIVLEEEENSGTIIWLHGYGLTEIGSADWKSGYRFIQEDVIGAGCAAPAGFTVGKTHTFRILVKKCMFEFYLDDNYVQTYNTTHYPDKPGIAPQRIGFAVCNGKLKVTDIKINKFK